MATDDGQQISLPSLFLVAVLSGLIIRYLFFAPPAGRSSPPREEPAAVMRQREAAAERIMQMFPYVDRRTALWNLHRTGGNLQATSERVLVGLLETVRFSIFSPVSSCLLKSVPVANAVVLQQPPITFQPPIPPGTNRNNNNDNNPSPQPKPAAGSAHPDLITRYNLRDKLNTLANESENGKGWSSKPEERQSLLQRRRDQMILEARRKMEAKIAAEKAKAAGGN
jgi:coupling of ubiquitin conjugation to ER degradation protein 1